MKLQEGLLFVAIFTLFRTQMVTPQSLLGCTTRCGNVTVEYPFGISPECHYAGDETFHLTCNEKDELIFGKTENQVISISHSGQLRIMVPISYTCYDSQGNQTESHHTLLQTGGLTLSHNNSFTGVGCNTYVLLRHSGDETHTTGCISGCDPHSPPSNGSCTGEGCCQTSVPGVSDDLFFFPRIFDEEADGHQSNHCTYAFLVENDKFSFSALEDLKNLRNVKEFPVVLDWSIGSQTCEQVGNTSLCGGNSTCINSSVTTGYNCKCYKGFDGNPHLPNGCQGTVKLLFLLITCACAFSHRYLFFLGQTSMSVPILGQFDSAKGCTRKESKDIRWIGIVLGTTTVILVLLLGLCFINRKMRQWKGTKIRQQFFEQNGGVMLRQRLSRPGPSNVDVKIFTEESMKTATNGYDESRILGEGGQGTVYKGILPDNSIVAIKKSRLGDSSQVEQFINEVLVLSQINHRNVVKLLGCCLETEIPLLIYEFVTNGTLFDHLHGSMFDSSLTWEHRLRIAVEVAGTLAYLHSSAAIPIIHRDVKTANILLDENLIAKVADFGASRLIPMDKEQLTTMVQGTLGYLDPEYYNTGLLNEKSDVYSFGVVLMELVTGQKAMCFERPQYSKHLVSYFASATKENRLDEIIDREVMNMDTHREIQEVAKIAVWCTRLTGDERPKMKEVSAELESMRVRRASTGRWINILSLRRLSSCRVVTYYLHKGIQVAVDMTVSRLCQGWTLKLAADISQSTLSHIICRFDCIPSLLVVLLIPLLSKTFFSVLVSFTIKPEHRRD